MKKMILLVILACSSAFGAFPDSTNYANINMNEVTGNFNSFNWSWIGMDNQDVTFNVQQGTNDFDISPYSLGYKMSRMTRTGQVDYVVILDSDITAVSSVVTFSVANTNIPPNNEYLGELFVFTGATTNETRTLAQGKVSVSKSLYANDALFNFPDVEGLLAYVRKDGDFDQFTALGGTDMQVFAADGAGGGSWEDVAIGAHTAVLAGDGINVNTSGVNNTVSVDATVIRADGSVDYTGDQSMGDNGITDVGYVDFNVTDTNANAVGRLRWDSDEGTVNIGMVGGIVVQQVGFELYVKARNQTGTTITNGSAVYISGGLGDQVLMSLANASVPETYSLLGLATENILHTETGHITIEGEVRGLDTSAWPVGTDLYVSTSDGILTDSIPTAPTDAIIKVCVVKRQHANEGSLLVHDITPFTLAEDFDGSLRYTIRNTSTNSGAQAMVTVMNDRSNRASFAIGGSGFPMGADLVSLYNQGNNAMAYVNDGPVDHVWFSNPDGLGDFGGYTNEIMRLAADGTLTVEGYDVIESARRSIPILNALPDDRPILNYVTDGVTVTGIVDTTDLDGDFVVNFNSGVSTFSVPVELILDNGATNVQQFSYIYATPQGITNSTTWPTGEYAMLFDLSLLDAPHTLSDGMFTLRRWTDKISGPNGENRSLVQRIAERVRQEPAAWKSGGELSSTVVTQGGTDDDVYLTHTSGISYQMHRQLFSAVTATNGTQEYHVYNDPSGAIAHITNLNQITQDANGDTVFDTANSWFNIAVLRHISSGTTNVIDSEIILNLSLNDYATEAGALADSSGNLVLTVPTDMVGETIVLGFITLNRTSAGSGTWTATATSLLGTPVGGQGGGASSLPASSTFTDSAFKVVDDSDPTKVLQFQNSGITTGTTRTMTIPDASGTLFLSSGVVDMTGSILAGSDSIYNLGSSSEKWGMTYTDNITMDATAPVIGAEGSSAIMVLSGGLSGSNPSVVLYGTNSAASEPGDILLDPAGATDTVQIDGDLDMKDNNITNVTRFYFNDDVYIEALGTTNFLFTAGTNSAIIGWE
jgi:hypothetical protein